MKKYMDKLKSNFHINKNLFIFLLIILISGVISGAIFAIILDNNDKKMVFDYLNNFFINIQKGELDFNTSIINSFVFSIGFVFLIWLLGISVIGFFIIIFFLFLKAFIIGFSIGSIILNFKLKGILLSLIYVFPHQIINIFIYMLISAYGLIVSFKIIRCFLTKTTLDFRNILNRYFRVLIFSVIILIFTNLYEIYAMPRLLNFILKF